MPKAYVIVCEDGCYSDYSKTVICVSLDKDKAEEIVAEYDKKADEKARVFTLVHNHNAQFQKENPAPKLPMVGRNYYARGTPEYERWSAAYDVYRDEYDAAQKAFIESMSYEDQLIYKDDQYASTGQYSYEEVDLK